MVSSAKQRAFRCREWDVESFLEHGRTQIRVPVKLDEDECFTTVTPTGFRRHPHCPHSILRDLKPPLGIVGDYLYGTEVWCREGGLITYRADGDWIKDFHREHPDHIRRTWLSAGRMNRDDARIWLRVIHIRAQRLQEITELEAVAEGCSGPEAVNQFRERWDVRYGPQRCRVCKGTGQRLIKPSRSDRGIEATALACQSCPRTGWDQNPWVWVYDLKQVKRP